MVIDMALPAWIYPILVWSIIWKAIGAWKAARKGHLIWFVSFFVFNTAGILPIIYIFFFQNYEFSGKPRRSKTKKRSVKKSKKFPSLS
jgi:hypothetical protein